MSQLKACPFCGKQPTVTPYGVIHCADEECPAIVSTSHNTTEEAIAAWNTRPLEKELAEALLPFKEFADRWDAKPILNHTDMLYAVHGGKDCNPKIGAEFRLSDCYAARTALKKAGIA